MQDSIKSWRPTAGELLCVIPRTQAGESLISAGTVYGAGRQIKDSFPDPAILLYGAGLNTIGSMPYFELRESISRARKTLESLGILDDLDIKVVLEAASQRAQFDKVGAMLRREFRDGLLRPKKCNAAKIDEVVPQIVNVTHQVRHKAQADHYGWASTPSVAGHYFSDASHILRDQVFWEGFILEAPSDYMVYGQSLFERLEPYAQVGAANSIDVQLITLRSKTTTGCIPE